MTSAIASIPKFQFFDYRGVPLVGGTLTTYSAGGTTLTATYQDQALSSVNTNPIELDSRGECVLWLDATKNYKFVLKNAAGAPQWTQDNITNSTAFATAGDAAIVASLSGSGGSDLIGYLPADANAVPTTVQAKLRETVSVLDFGADPTGGVDSTTAVQNALDAAISSGQKLDVVGTFLLTGTVHIVKTSGDRTPTYISGGGTFKKVNAGAMFDATNNATGEVFFNNIRFLGDSTAGSIAIKCNREFIRGYFTNCSFYGIDVCFDSTAYLMQTFRITGCDFGNIGSWVIDCGATGGFPTGSAYDVHVLHCQIEGQSGGVFRGSSGSVSVRNCVIENLSTQPAFDIKASGALNISENYFEDCTNGVVVCAALSNCTGIVVQNNYVSLATGTEFIVWGKTLSGCLTIGNVVDGGKTNDTTQVTSGVVGALGGVNIGGELDGSASRSVALIKSGSFTPVVYGATTAGTATYAEQTGWYQQVGSVVYFNMSVRWSGHTGTGALLITLPVQSTNNAMGFAVLPDQVTGLAIPADRTLTAGCLDGGPYLFLLEQLTTGGAVYFTLSLASYADGGISINGSYAIRNYGP